MQMIKQGGSHDKQVMATALVANDIKSYAFRSELEGMYNRLCHVDTRMQSTCGTITQYCDCEGAVKWVVNPILHPRETMAPEADIVMAIQHKNKTSTSDIDIIHIKGHQDNMIKYEELSFPSQCNVDCDERVKQYTW